MKFEDKIKKLEEIVLKLESNETPLDEAMSLYEEGIALSKELTEILSKAEAKIKNMTSEQE